MGVRTFIRRLDRWAARFNKWLGPTAAATNVQGPGRPPSINETSVAIVLGEIEKGDADSKDQETARGG